MNINTLKALLLVLLMAFSNLLTANDSVLLLKTYNAQNHKVMGWLMSEKLDGIRAIWNGEQLLSKQGNPIHAPDWFLQQLPPFAIDGELWTQRNDVENISSIVRQQQPDQRWQQISYQIFEVPNQAGGLMDRLAVLSEFLNEHPSSFIHIIEQRKISSKNQLKQQLQQVTALGGEGLVVRNPDTPYHTGRSDQALKIKPYQDAECTVIGYKAGKGKYAGKTGSLKCQLDSGLIIFLGSGLSDQQRLTPPALGSLVTFKYYGLTKNKKPRFPIFLRIRQ
jgi:DNA ligase-1